MIRRDFIIRSMQQLGEVVARVLRLRERGDYDEALVLLDAACRQMLGLNGKLLDSLSTDDLLSMLSVGQTLDLDKCILLAELLSEQGDVYEAQGRTGASYDSHVKALDVWVYAYLSYDHPYLEERRPAIEALLERLEPQGLPADTELNLADYFERTGRYAKAEDLLFHLMEDDPDDEELHQEGFAFYARLLARSDSDLEVGNLPRDEVEEGLTRLRRLHEE
ncbi:MAG: DUF6483 family protein [Chloroflexota bacterium]|nr:DUF6483 family protein [Chloroflexota bacterium]